MPRIARRVLPGFPHHITQRGTDRQNVFYSLKDRRVYLELLKENSRRSGVGLLAYCLMRNHIHLIAVPEDEESLAICLRRTHGRYAQYLNARRLRSGHLWQNRFYSCAMEGGHLWSAIRYVEQNPVRAGLVVDAGDYRWSSAAAHLSGRDSTHLLDMQFWALEGGVEQWAGLLGAAGEEAETKRLRRATYGGNPLGSEEFVAKAKVLLAEQTSHLTERMGPGREGGVPLASRGGIWTSGGL